MNPNQNLHHRALGIEQRLEAFLDDILHLDLVIDHGFDREQPASDHVDDPGPDRQRVTERPLDGEVLHDQLEGRDPHLTLHEADDDDDTLGPHRIDAGLKRARVASTFHGSVDADAFGRLLARPVPDRLVVGSMTIAPTPSCSMRWRRLAFGSLTRMRPAPAARAASTVRAPIGPAPVTRMLPPGCRPLRSTAWTATAAGWINAPC